MDLFGQVSIRVHTQQVPYGEFINEDANFHSFYQSILALIRASTGESWNGMMHDCMDEQGIIAVFFWIVFVLLTFFIFMNIFVAVIYENFQAITSGDSNSEVLSLKRRDIKNFLNTWSLFDPSGDLYFPAVAFPRFLRSLP